MMQQYLLIGYPLSHSFSKKYFTKFFLEQQLHARYDNLEVASLEKLPEKLKQYTCLKGCNVTLPYKRAIMQYLDSVDTAATDIGAVNTVKVLEGGRLVGYNTDWLGFKDSLQPLLGCNKGYKALILGNGGAAKAVQFALSKMQIPFLTVSRRTEPATILYRDITQDVIENHLLIINTTPLGMYPNIESCPPIAYDALGEQHILYDLVYNPKETLFLKKGKERGALVKNGLEMLVLQAKAAWNIWNQ